MSKPPIRTGRDTARAKSRQRYNSLHRRSFLSSLNLKLLAILIVIAGVVGGLPWLKLGTSTAAAEQIQWLPVPAQSLMVDAGSPLDLSSYTPAGPAGSFGPLQLAGDGQLVFTGQSTPARFNCGMIANGTEQTVAMPTHLEADALAVQMKRHGYTLARLHNVDYRLLRTARTEGEVDPQELDRFYYLAAALKRNGIYWMADVLTQPAHGLSGADFGHGASPDDLRIRIDFDPNARAQWLRFVDKVYGARNPYTGMTMLRDPSMAFMVGANESSLGFAARPAQPFPTGLPLLFSAWLHRRYPTPALLGAAIPELSDAEKIGRTPIAAPFGWDDAGQRLNFFLLFASGLEVDTYHWMTSELGVRGFHGPVLGYDDWYKQLNNRTRARLPIIDVHAYVGEVSSQALGAQFKLPSATEDEGLAPILVNAGARWLDRPMVLSEYSIPYPNPHRYEAGILFPAVAALQGYSTICRMASLPVEPEIPPAGSNSKPLRAYAAGLDPNERAQETLSAMLFARGDVRPANHIVALPFGEQQMNRPGSGFLSAPIRRAALLARFGLVTPEGLAKLPAAIAVAPGAVPSTMRDEIMTRVSGMLSGSGTSETDAIVTGLKTEGALSTSNQTNAGGGLFQSETGELIIDQHKSMISVVTPRTEALSVANAASAILLGRMTVKSINGGALIAATALDGQPLATSHKVLLIMTGDTKSSGLLLDGDARTPRLADWGRLPILMRRIIAEVDLRVGSGRAGKLTVLSLQGKPQSAVPTAPSERGGVTFTLDTGAVDGSPTTYFLYES
jgi:hypothetical protein